MAKNLAKVLKADMPRLPLRKAAEELRKKGRGRDTMLAHITPQEAELLKSRGGRGTINPDTGLPEFDFWDTFTGFFTPDTSGYAPTVQQPEFTGYQDTGAQPNVQVAQDAPGGMTSGQQDLMSQDYMSQVASGYAAPGQEIWSGYTPSSTQFATTPASFSASAPVQAPTFAAPTADYQLTPQQQAEVQSDLEGQPIDLTTKAPSAGGINTPFGNIATKDLIAALGIGGLGANYLMAQGQGKKAAAQLQGAYNQAAAQEMQLAQPYMQQGGQQLSQALTGALSPAQQQQLQAAQAQAAQGTVGRGGAGAAQAGRSIEDLRQRLLANQQTMALQLLGAGTPLVNQAIRDQLAGTTTGINTNMQLSQQAGQAATGMLGMLASMYGRSA
ncbi:hypothetical protein UFOVP95_20 [uncultured Caudovirales phage]|uniref:Uncharacterized protein n=1 Tax=uncultured Caudovirales phage TaxID=2100421 RepID=A0A6J5L1S4_9CAUD|nr:hypothetical protein UFOVP95_20 [uncultured Caudovirales phage]